MDFEIRSFFPSLMSDSMLRDPHQLIEHGLFIVDKDGRNVNVP